jgi:hypothetical protein
MNRRICNHILIVSACLLIMTTACSKKSDTPSTTVPVLTTSTVTAITETTATSGGNITSNGGASVIVRGICWSLSANPTLADSKTIDGTGSGSFTSAITGLTANTLYYVRAYATNSAGTAYGDQKSFTTQKVIIPVFSVSSKTVALQGGGDGLQFFAKCLNTDVKMTKVNIIDPLHGATITYNMLSQICTENEQFDLQPSDTAYPKEVGTWQFEFIGTRNSTGEPFDITITLAVTKK